MFDRTHYGIIKPEILDALDDYGRDGLPVGDFLSACLANDFTGAVCRADDVNRHRLPEIAKYIYNELPSDCHGDRATVRAWVEKHNREAMAAEAAQGAATPAEAAGDRKPKATRKSLERAAAGLGATVSIASTADGLDVEVCAPHGQHWKANGTHVLVGSQGDGDSAETVYRDLIERIAYGIEACDPGNPTCADWNGWNDGA